MRAKITNKLAERFAGEDKAHQVLWDSGDGAVKGFGLRYFPGSGIRTYFMQSRVKGTGKMRTVKIGRHGDPWLVDQARARARELKGQMVDGVDPVLERQRQQGEREAQEARDKALGTTLQQVLDSYLANKDLRPRTADDYKAHCKRNFTEWLDEPIANLTRDMCLTKFRALSTKTKAQAMLSMAYLRALCNHARILHRTKDGHYPVLPINPVKDMWELADPHEKKTRKTRIPLERVGECWNWLRERSRTANSDTSRTAADFVSLVLLTGCRRNEAGGLLWTDVDLDSKTLTLREEVTKTKRELVLPLSTPLHEILTARKNAVPLPDKVLRRRRATRAVQYVFPSGGAKTAYMVQAPSVMASLTKIAGKYVHMHALRRTFDDIGMECRVDGDIRRALINHVGKDVHGTNYSNNPAFLVQAVEQIAQWVVNQSAIAAGTNVIRFPAKAAG